MIQLLFLKGQMKTTSFYIIYPEKGGEFMKLFMKLLTAFLFAGVLFVTMNSAVAEASEKIYREYQFKAELNKFPIKLTNGLTINKKVTQEYI